MVGHKDDSRAPRAAARSFVAMARGLAFGSMTVLTSCGGDAELGDYPASTCDLGEAPSGLRDVPIDIATFWAEDARERVAFDALTKYVDRAKYYPSTDQMLDRVATQQHIRDAFAAEKRELPDVFQVNGGSDVVGWVYGREGDARELCALDALRATNRWHETYFADALEPISCDGSLYALPVGIHHINVLFYNWPLFDRIRALASDNGVDLARPEDLRSPAQLVELLNQVSKLDTSSLGEGIAPLAIGSSNNWPLTIVAFENVLLGLGRDAYETLWKGGLEDDDGSKAVALEGTLRAMLDVLRGLVQHSNYGDGHEWQAAMRQVGAGQALFSITGDWGYAQLDEAHLPDVATVTFPGTKGTFIYTPDSFAVPRNLGENGFQARDFLNDVAQDKEALIAFSNAKHSIPPRTDLIEAELAQLVSPGLRATYDEFASCARGDNDCRLLLAVSGLGPSPGIDPCLDEVDAILALAVAGKEISATTDRRGCDSELPKNAREAEEYLIKLWLELAQRRFAASCR